MVAQERASVAGQVGEFVPVKTWKEEGSSRALRREAGSSQHFECVAASG